MRRPGAPQTQRPDLHAGPAFSVSGWEAPRGRASGLVGGAAEQARHFRFQRVERIGRRLLRSRRFRRGGGSLGLLHGGRRLRALGLGGFLGGDLGHAQFEIFDGDAGGFGRCLGLRQVERRSDRIDGGRGRLVSGCRLSRRGLHHRRFCRHDGNDRRFGGDHLRHRMRLGVGLDRRGHLGHDRFHGNHLGRRGGHRLFDRDMDGGGFRHRLMHGGHIDLRHLGGSRGGLRIGKLHFRGLDRRSDRLAEQFLHRKHRNDRRGGGSRGGGCGNGRGGLGTGEGGVGPLRRLADLRLGAAEAAELGFAARGVIAAGQAAGKERFPAGRQRGALETRALADVRRRRGRHVHRCRLDGRRFRRHQRCGSSFHRNNGDFRGWCRLDERGLGRRRGGPELAIPQRADAESGRIRPAERTARQERAARHLHRRLDRRRFGRGYRSRVGRWRNGLGRLQLRRRFGRHDVRRHGCMGGFRSRGLQMRFQGGGGLGRGGLGRLHRRIRRPGLDEAGAGGAQILIAGIGALGAVAGTQIDAGQIGLGLAGHASAGQGTRGGARGKSVGGFAGRQGLARVTAGKRFAGIAGRQGRAGLGGIAGRQGLAAGAADAGLDDHVGGATHQKEMFDLVAAHQHQTPPLVHRNTVENSQTMARPGDAAPSPTAADPPHQEHGEGEQRCDNHQGDRHSSRKLKLRAEQILQHQPSSSLDERCNSMKPHRTRQRDA
ncbi:hypothetical protein AZC_1665 [Azorhizobium caulinodans ORS 571]|uniref:Uncharacterized protein n=1 Tax=Azorhizobium caulinodans (strain ATCC 43989 / DSM 5975 / JCM 20966 / LMG 6465 / NBRC 14845 / NCIMB 13405 / ORS 571) TaxID=438753 RepID=A8I3X8_AZOC5|nr:hypothetical protein AZC_1665 [Azorhizobium caulinodans ORS 571]